MTQIADLKPGARFGRWLVSDATVIGSRRKPYVQCTCECGAQKLVRFHSLTCGDSKSCGCLGIDTRAARAKYLPEDKPLLRAYNDMMSRCYNPKVQSYQRYGGRGIVVCSRWRESKVAFIADMKPTYFTGGSLDRRDNEGIYSPENCRWATQKEQQNNKSTCVLLELGGITQTLTQWAEAAGLSKHTLSYRLKNGMKLEAALLKKVGR